MFPTVSICRALKDDFVINTQNCEGELERVQNFFFGLWSGILVEQFCQSL